MALLTFLLFAVFLFSGSTQAWLSPFRRPMLHHGSLQRLPAAKASISSLASLFSIAATGTTTAPTTTPTTARTQCNGHAAFCTRPYSNVTMVGAHNSPFIQRHNLAANQERSVTQQLDDGVRFLQAQIQWPANASTANATVPPHFCHTSCELLDAGPITDWLGQVNDWVERHPDDVVTVLLGNGNYSPPALYAPYIAATGLVQYAYVPSRPGASGSWPTLGAMLAANRRVVLLLDYKANETAYPWLLDEFAYLWETPFDPLVDVPPSCAVQRPPGLAAGDARDRRLYLMNHNLNVEVTLWDYSFLIPASTIANATNAATGASSVGAAADACTALWGRPPNVLNVDYYNRGSPPGSVFQVAARLNGVPYTGTCCNQTAPATNAGVGSRGDAQSWFLATFVALGVVAWLWR